ncbi:MAG: phosphatase PAP2 family protein [Dehalococcoidia bacterium]
MTFLAVLAHSPATGLNGGVAIAAALVVLLLGWRTVGAAFAALCAALAIAAFVIIGSPASAVAMATVLAGLTALGWPSTTDFRRSAGPFARECLLVGGGLAVYTALRLIESDAEPALANATRLIAFERSAGLYIEPGLQDWVLRSELLTRALNWVYSFSFLAITAGALLWLWFVDERNYRLLRNMLGVSALLAIITIAVFPVAPPRLVEGSGMVDTVVLFGRQHSFANEFAAVPSLHVGWMAAVGYALALTLGGRRAYVVGALPAALMTITVIATGNHLWIDGAIGIAYALGAALVLSRPSPASDLRRSLAFAGRWTQHFAMSAGRPAASVATNGRARFTLLALGGLLTYLIAEQIVDPGFTDFWGYLLGQVAVALALLVVFEVLFEREGGLSWLTHVVGVACCYADVLGTDGNLYAAINEYDKITHFAGVAAVTAGAYDCLRALNTRNRASQSPTSRLWLSVTVGVAIGVGWEIYELLGDKVFHTARVYGPWDTLSDIVSDAMGALSVALLLWLAEQQRAPASQAMEASAPERAAGDR